MSDVPAALGIMSRRHAGSLHDRQAAQELSDGADLSGLLGNVLSGNPPDDRPEGLSGRRNFSRNI